MKHTKKLIPAIGMLLLSASMLVTSTFAWFSMNDKVTADGMTIAAKGDQVYLQIINESLDPSTKKNAFIDGAAQTRVNGNLTATGDNALLPTAVHPVTGTTYQGGKFGTGYKWVYASGIDAVNGAVNTTGYKDVESGQESKHYLVNTFKIRLDPTAGKTEASNPLTVSSVAFMGDSYTPDALGTSVSVLVVCGEQSELWTQAAGVTDGTFTKAGGDDFLSKDETKNVFNNSTTGVEVKIYVFFNGDDADCTLENLAKAKENSYNNYSVEVTFKV